MKRSHDRSDRIRKRLKGGHLGQSRTRDARSSPTQHRLAATEREIEEFAPFLDDVGIRMLRLQFEDVRRLAKLSDEDSRSMMESRLEQIGRDLARIRRALRHEEEVEVLYELSA